MLGKQEYLFFQGCSFWWVDNAPIEGHRSNIWTAQITFDELKKIGHKIRWVRKEKKVDMKGVEEGGEYIQNTLCGIHI